MSPERPGFFQRLAHAVAAMSPRQRAVVGLAAASVLIIYSVLIGLLLHSPAGVNLR